MQLSATNSTGPALPVEAPPVSPPTPGAEPLPEHEIVTNGWHEKPSPQSLSALHGSAHLNVHDETVWLVQTGSALPEVSHLVLGAQGGGVSPAEQVVSVVAWQTIPTAQSLSAVHGPGRQVEIVVGSVDGGSPVPPSAAGVPLPLLFPAPEIGTIVAPPVGAGEPTVGSWAAAPPVPLTGQPTSAGQAGDVGAPTDVT